VKKLRKKIFFIPILKLKIWSAIKYTPKCTIEKSIADKKIQIKILNLLFFIYPSKESKNLFNF